MTQIQLIELFKSLNYQTYYKFGSVIFAIATHEQEVITSINGEKETKNIAKKGDYIIEGASNEYYVLTPETFDKNYVVTNICADLTGKAKTFSNPRFAVQWTGDNFTFMAKWRQEMICNTDDFLVAPQDLSEVYRIEKETFYKTYIPK